MVSRALSVTLSGILLDGCFQGHLSRAPNPTASASDPTATTELTGGPLEGLFACAAPPCPVLLVSQTLDDRIDVFDVRASPHLRGRIGQIDGTTRRGEHRRPPGR